MSTDTPHVKAIKHGYNEVNAMVARMHKGELDHDARMHTASRLAAYLDLLEILTGRNRNVILEGAARKAVG